MTKPRTRPAPPRPASGGKQPDVGAPAMDDDALVGDGFKIPAAAVHMTAARSSGPGGQNVNKVSTKIDLRLDPEAIEGLSHDDRARLAARVGARHWDGEGRLMVQSQRFREQRQNLRDACEKLVALIAAAIVKPKPRRPTRPGRGAVERRLSEKKRHSDRKRARGRVDD